MEPLQAAHADGLRDAVGEGALSRLWYTSVPVVEQVDAYIAAALAACANGAALPFVVRDAAGDIVGCTRYYALDAAVPRLSIGYTWYAPRVQRSGVNTEAKLMLLQHAFETPGCLSVVFETSWFNHTRARLSHGWAQSRTACCAITPATPTVRRAIPWCPPSSIRNGPG